MQVGRAGSGESDLVHFWTLPCSVHHVSRHGLLTGRNVTTWLWDSSRTQPCYSAHAGVHPALCSAWRELHAPPRHPVGHRAGGARAQGRWRLGICCPLSDAPTRWSVAGKALVPHHAAPPSTCSAWCAVLGAHVEAHGGAARHTSALPAAA